MTNEEREKAIAIDVFERQIKRSEDVKCRRCDECGENPFEDYCIKDVAKWLSLALEALKQKPREHGEWIKMPLTEVGQTYSHKCSLCGRRILATNVELSEFPYCHCGADMRKEQSNV